jgi:hypothetical protein
MITRLSSDRGRIISSMSLGEEEDEEDEEGVLRLRGEEGCRFGGWMGRRRICLDMVMGMELGELARGRV